MIIRVKFTDMPFGFKSKDNVFFRTLCKRYEVELSDDPDYVFYGPFGTDFLRYKNAVKIFVANEPVYPNFNDCDYALGTLDMELKGRYFKMPPYTDYGERDLWKEMLSPASLDSSFFNRKFCNFVYSNSKNGTGAKLRIDFCKQLSEYRSVDCPGEVLNNVSEGIAKRYARTEYRNPAEFNENWVRSKLDFLKNYKFTIAFENAQLPGWTTEKLIHPFMARSVPIYWGDPNVAEYFNPKAFINCNDYDNNFDAVIRVVKEVDADSDKYMEMLNQPALKQSYPVNWESDLLDFFVGIIEGTKRLPDKNPIGFEAVTARSYSSLIEEGKIGLRKITRDTFAYYLVWIKNKKK